MAFNLNTSRKPEYSLNENLTHESISMYGIPCKWLYAERINHDDLVFKDFTHFKVNKDYKEVFLRPETTENWDGDVLYNNFGLFNQWSQNLFISKQSILELYPDFLETTGSRSQIVNSLLVTPSGTILEVTHVESFTEGINNVWGFADNPSSYKLSVKIYDNNLADEGVTEVKDSIKLDEDEIFEYDEEIDTSDIDKFFENLSDIKDKQNEEGNKISNNDNPFGTLG